MAADTSCSKAINGTNTYIILSETPRFSIIGDDCVDPATFHEPGCSSVSPPPRVRQRAIESNIVPRSGKVPDVIGWGPTGYNDPKFP